MYSVHFPFINRLIVYHFRQMKAVDPILNRIVDWVVGLLSHSRRCFQQDWLLPWFYRYFARYIRILIVNHTNPKPLDDRTRRSTCSHPVHPDKNAENRFFKMAIDKSDKSDKNVFQIEIDLSAAVEQVAKDQTMCFAISVELPPVDWRVSLLSFWMVNDMWISFFKIG